MNIKKSKSKKFIPITKFMVPLVAKQQPPSNPSVEFKCSGNEGKYNGSESKVERGLQCVREGRDVREVMAGGKGNQNNRSNNVRIPQPSLNIIKKKHRNKDKQIPLNITDPQTQIKNKDIRKYMSSKDKTKQTPTLQTEQCQQSNRYEYCKINVQEQVKTESYKSVSVPYSVLMGKLDDKDRIGGLEDGDREKSKQRQLLLTNSRLKLHIPIDKIRHFGIFEHCQPVANQNNIPQINNKTSLLKNKIITKPKPGTSTNTPPNRKKPNQTQLKLTKYKKFLHPPLSSQTNNPAHQHCHHLSQHQQVIGYEENGKLQNGQEQEY